VLGSAVLKGPDVIQTKQQFDIVFGLSGVKEDVMAQDMTIVFDESRLEFISAHSLQEDAFTIVDYKQLAGKLRLLSVHKQDLVSDKNLDYMKLTFKVREDAAAGAANVAVSEIIIADSHGVETELQGASHSTVVGVIDKAALNALLAEARIIHDAAVEGNRIGQYPAGSKAALEQVLRSTALVAADVNASHADVMEAVKALDAALQAFKDLVITSIIGDINNDQRVSIGDLAILAKSYGKTSQSPDWETIKGRDLNHDGKIDIEDLAAMARLIFNEQ
jgi:hypothetical protein